MGETDNCFTLDQGHKEHPVGQVPSRTNVARQRFFTEFKLVTDREKGRQKERGGVDDEEGKLA